MVGVFSNSIDGEKAHRCAKGKSTALHLAGLNSPYHPKEERGKISPFLIFKLTKKKKKNLKSSAF